MTQRRAADLRRTPTQLRSRERREAILVAAALAFASPGFDAATMDGIAAAAGTSIGSVYQFFANKPAILAALSDRYLVAARALFDDVMGPAALARPWRRTIGALVDGFVALEADELFRPIRQNWHLVQTLPGRGLHVHRELAARAEPFCVRHLPGLPPGQRIPVAIIVAEVIGAMLFLAGRQPAAMSGATMSHAKDLIVRFLAPYARRPRA